MPNIISTSQFKKNEVERILFQALQMEKECASGNINQPLKNKIVVCVFFEPSTRTRLSFETAALKLGASVISVENAKENSSAYKGESIEDTTRMLCSYADVIIMRHFQEGVAEKAATVATKPIINAGDGSNQHPSQAFLDLYTIKKEHNRLDHLNITFVGDLLHSRTLHSLMPFLMMYPGNTFCFISPRELSLPKEYVDELQKKGVSFKEMQNLEKGLSDTDVLYMTRVQKERFQNLGDYEKVKDLFLLKKEHLKDLKKEAIIMHPLPRVNEIDPEIDKDPRAAYFRQAQNGLYIRMALLSYALGL